MDDLEKQVDISEQKTNLEWDNYINFLIEAIDESNFMKRAEYKPMQTTKHDLESHITSRATHSRAAADIAKRIAEALNLNYNYIYAAMLMHDAGHPFSAHDGEEIFTGIGELHNVDYYHHNAKGVEVIISEDICGKAINKIPNIKNKPELRKKLEDEFYYFLDVVISHDGEAGAKELGAKPQEYPDIKTAVYEKLRLSNSQNNYKFIAQTIEGRIAKYADVIAYLSTDIQDRFRLGIQKDFDEDYLEFIGEILADDFAKTREEKVEIAKNIIDEIKEEKLMQLVDDAKEIENKETISHANEIIKRIYDTTENYEEMPYIEQANVAEQITSEYLKEYKKVKFSEGMTDEEKKFINADMEKMREFVRKKLRMRTSVIEAVTSRIRETLINDLLKESRSNGELGFSKSMQNLFFRAKELNYKFVPDTKWNYQKEGLLQATHELVQMVALSLKQSGAIETKFYDQAIRKHVKNPEALEYLKTDGYTEPEEREIYKSLKGIRNIRRSNTKFTAEGGTRNKTVAEAELVNSTYHYVLDEGRMFAIMYENTFESIENQIMAKVRSAAGKLPEAEAKKRKTDIGFFDQKIKEQEDKLREELISKYGELEQITDDQIEEFARPMIKNERDNIENKMAMQMAINYLAGMTDKAMFTHLIEIGLIDKEDIDNGVRGSTEEEKRIFSERYDMSVPEEQKNPEEER